MPPGDFWDGLAQSLSRSSGEMTCFLTAMVVVVFIVVKYYMPGRRDQKEFEAEMKQKQLELEAKRQQDAVDVQREDIESRARQVEILVNLSEQVKSLAQQTAGLTTQVAVAIAKLEYSEAGSAKLGQAMHGMADDVAQIKEQVRDVHSVLYHPDAVD